MNPLFRTLAILAAFSFGVALAHDIEGTVANQENGEPVAYANVSLVGTPRGAVANADGFFTITGARPGRFTLRAECVGYASAEQEITIGSGQEVVHVHFHLQPRPIELDELVVSADRSFSAASSEAVRQVDLRLRPRRSGQDLLRLTPGLVVAQHAGGGKAEQIFIRGFDADHGTDLAVFVDGLPVNMVSHGHGQGYADLHFLLPEVVGKVEVHKGPYWVRYGDFATAGAVEFSTRDELEQNQIVVEGGEFGTYRLTALSTIPLASDQSSAYFAASSYFTDGPVDAPQNLGRYNLFGKFRQHLSGTSSFEATLSSFASSWDASGQIPQRAVERGWIDRFGALDDTEGGATSRTDLRLAYENWNRQGDRRLRLLAGYTRYAFRLYSDFTYFLEDPLHGDEIEQVDQRGIWNLRAEYEQSGVLLDRPYTWLFGASARGDAINNALWHTERRVRLEATKEDRIQEQNLAIYAQLTLGLAERLDLLVGARLDGVTVDVEDRLAAVSGGGGGNTGVVGDHVVSPKLNLVYRPRPELDLFLNSGFGFHSNDARAVVAEPDRNHLAQARGVEVGSRLRLWSRLNTALSVWGLRSEQEAIWIGDGGEPEFSGRTERWGLDWEARLVLLPWLFADADLNLADGRVVDAPAGADNIPLAPRLTSTGGLTVDHPRGYSATLRYRHIGDRPANEEDSVTAAGYFLVDLTLGRRIGRFSLSATVENLTDREWNEAQFDTESRIKAPDGQLEPEPVSELHFTPGSPRNFRLQVGFAY